MTKKAPQVDREYKPNPKYSLEVLNEFPNLTDWLKQICRFGRFEDFIFISDYKKGEIHIKIFTKDHYYCIGIVLPGIRDKKRFEEREDNGYLGCISSVRKARAGEDWLRGNDLSDDSYSVETWQKIKNDILAYELVKVVRNSSNKGER